ncbi:isoprenyl transferase [Alkalilimnicola ehrlichii MLHE-1]|uniref:Ditrans,polycis-undecaprenyl-diphosphate synthase ((2E,6E)-farnesyl-diphosphate specific) n=1 Tax=Alkalilimnicola ehrlichii (strain ATCC BAA-1101 / DSM 17681 / MLHE-1) TaxID=187272 RepID=Q0A7I4_ALKEH|nr:isoprenyl transferase [Alkalilimnicola ehrlichii]ABI57203.1 Undecaprenyl pyrophosphate synthetase [Alkalilimnicola ehrlichii MLHE-1]
MGRKTANDAQVSADGPLPEHVAIIMDGNGRWARARGLPRHAGHRAGAATVRRVVEHCGRLGIHALTLFAFSSENWRRPRKEVSVLMELFLSTLDKESARLHRNDVRLRFMGAREDFPRRLQQRLADAEALTRDNTGLQLNVAASYGGRWDIANAARRLAEAVQAGHLQPDEITTETLGKEVCLAELPEPDLFIRTGGERRISNFMLWQLAYTELYFTPVLWPAFTTDHLDEALADFAGRERRFGRTSDQLQTESGRA